MDIMDKIGKKATNTCRVTINKTSKITQRTKLRMHINDCKDKIYEQYMIIGKKVYEKHARKENIDMKEDLQEECKKIDKFSKEIENSIEYLLILKNMKKCPKCYKEIMIDYNFCPNCGKKQNDEENRNKQVTNNLPNEIISDKNKQEKEISINESKEDIE